MLLVVPLIPEGNKETYNFCDDVNCNVQESYDKAFKMAFWLAKAYPDTVVYVDHNVIDKKNPVSQKIYSHLSDFLPDIKEYISKVEVPQNLSLCPNDFRMVINTYTYVTTNGARPSTGFMYLNKLFNFKNRINDKIYIQGGSIWGKESGTVNFPNLFNRTSRESMNMARNPDAFMELVKLVNGNIRIIPTAYTQITSKDNIDCIINSVFTPKEAYEKYMSYYVSRSEVIAEDALNKCCKAYYLQDRFKDGAKLFDVDLYNISNSSENYNFSKMKCAIRKGLGEMELHNGELDNNSDYEHFPEVEVVVSKKPPIFGYDLG